MRCRAAWFLVALMACATRVSAQSSSTASEFWPGLSLRYQWPSALSLTAFSEIKNADDIPYRQLGVGAHLGYQAKRMVRPHLVNINPSKEHSYFASAGYEYLHTIQSDVESYEDRLSVQATLRQRPASRVLLEDRNLVEFRWVNGTYSTRYRNMLTVEADLLIHKLRLTPYASAEVYYSWNKSSWNEQQYAVGIEWPYKDWGMLDTYYLRQNCTTCNPAHLDVAGLALSLYFGKR